MRHLPTSWHLPILTASATPYEICHSLRPLPTSWHLPILTASANPHGICHSLRILPLFAASAGASARFKMKRENDKRAILRAVYGGSAAAIRRVSPRTGMSTDGYSVMIVSPFLPFCLSPVLPFFLSPFLRFSLSLFWAAAP